MATEQKIESHGTREWFEQKDGLWGGSVTHFPTAEEEPEVALFEVGYYFETREQLKDACDGILQVAFPWAAPPRTCRKCGTTERVGMFHGERMCGDCGMDMIITRRREAAKERLESAQDVTADYQGTLYLDGFYENGYFDNAVDALEYLDFHDTAKDGPVPEWAFAATEEIRTLDVDDAIERLCEDGYPNMGENFSSSKELRESAARWSKENEGSLTVYHPDFTKKIHLERAAGRA